jgi:heme exporter protein D
MNWGSLAEFLAMGGYGLYVWGSFGMCALLLAGECLSLVQRRRALRELPLDDAEPLERPLHEA